MKKILLFPLFAALLSAGFAERIELGAGKTLHLAVPSGWAAAEIPEASPDAPAVGKSRRYVTTNGSNDALFITLLTVPDDNFQNPDNLRAMVETATQQLATGSVEGKANVEEIKIGGVTGFCVTFTDAQLVGKPTVKDDYKVVTSCFAYLGDRVLVTASIFTDDPDGPAYADARRMLKSLSLSLPNEAI